MTHDIAIRTIKDQLLQRLPALVEKLCPGMRRHGRYWQGPNPTRAKDSKSSFTVWATGAWKEFDAGEDEKGDVIDLIAYARRCARGEAIRWAKDWLGIGAMSAEDRARLDRLAAEKLERQKRQDEADAIARRRRAFDMWLKAGPIRAGGPVDCYLKHWHIDLAELANPAGDLREAGDLAYWGPRPDASDRFWRWSGPALVAPIRQLSGPAFGEIVGAQALFVQRDSEKLAPLPTPKVMLGSKKGGGVFISNGPSGLAASAVAASGLTEDLVVVEGVKTGLAAATTLPEVRIWSLLDLGNIAELPPLNWVRKLIVAIENDVKPKAIEARERTLNALTAKGFDLREWTPPWGSDLADTLKEG